MGCTYPETAAKISPGNLLYGLRIGVDDEVRIAVRILPRFERGAGVTVPQRPALIVGDAIHDGLEGWL